MISIKKPTQEKSIRVAIYALSPNYNQKIAADNKYVVKKSPENVYVTGDEISDEDDIVIPDSNIIKYLDLKIFNDGRYPIREGMIDQIKSCIIKNNPPDSSRTNPMLMFYYEKAMENILTNKSKFFYAEPNYRFYPAPTIVTDQRDYIIASGPAGSGKSRFAADAAQGYFFTYSKEKRKIYLISAKPKDEALDSLDYVIRLTPEQMEWFMFEKKKDKVEEAEEVDEDGKKKKKRKKLLYDEDDVDKDTFKGIEEYAKSLFIFDDIEHYPESLMKDVIRFKKYLVQVGRSSGIDIIYCNHVLRNGQSTRTDLAECSAVVLFPKANTMYHMSSYLKDYLSLDNASIEFITNIKEHWCMIYLNHPMVGVTEQMVFRILNKKKLRDNSNNEQTTKQ
jgi:hypothetical protein